MCEQLVRTIAGILYSMIITTTPTIQGKEITEYRGLVTGEAILGANIVRDFFAGVRDIVGGGGMLMVAVSGTAVKL